MSTQPTQATFGVADRAPVELPHPVRMRVLGAGDDRDLPGGPRPDGRRDRVAQDHHRPRRQRPLHLGVHRVSADLDDQRPAVRQAVRPVRSATDLPVRHRRLHDRLAAGRAVAGDVAARRGARRPGPRRGSALPDRPGRHRRPVRAVGARPLPGPVRSRVRPVRAHRTRDRRSHHRHRRLAVRVLLQPADRRVRVLHGLALPAALPPRRGAAQDRLPRGGPVHGGAGADPRRADEQGLGRVERPVRRRVDRSRGVDPRPVPHRRIAQRRADRAARPVPQPVVLDLGRGDVPGRLRVLRGRRLPAALVPGRGRVVGDGVGLPDAAAARRADRQRRRVRPDREPDRSLPGAHGRRARG